MNLSTHNLSAAPADAADNAPPSVAEIARKCTHCRECLAECRFLAEHDTPGILARQYRQDPEKLQQLAYSCSLCNLCTQICPQGLEPAAMFLDLRREAVRQGNWDHRAHKRLLGYEKLGGSRLFRYLSLPEGATTVFFPGCALPGARPEHTLQLFLYLKERDPSMGIMLDCCNKPSHDLGRQRYFEDRSQARNQLLSAQGIQTIVTACPNCYQAFSLSAGDFTVTTVYQLLADHGYFPRRKFSATRCTLHDPCSIRFEQDVHQAVRTIAGSLDLQLFEMEHNRATTLCCGEGGAAGCMGGDHAAAWADRRRRETDNHPLITYCAGCARMLQHRGRVHHIIDLLFPDAGSDHLVPRRIETPMTYLNRLKLKLKLRFRFGG